MSIGGGTQTEKGQGIDVRNGLRSNQAHSAFEIPTGFRIDKVDVATLLSARHKRSVRVLDDGRKAFGRSAWIAFYQRSPPMDRLIHPRSLFRARHDATVADNHVVAYDHAHVVQLEPLTGMNATDLTNGVRLDDPRLTVGAEIPGRLVVPDHNIPKVRLVLADPIPAVACNHARLVLPAVLCADPSVQFARTIHDLEVELVRLQSFVGGRTDLEGIVEPGEVSVRTIAAKLRFQLQLGNFHILCFCPVSNLFLVADILERDFLVFIDKEDAAAAGSDELPDLVFSFGKHAGLLVEPMRFVNEEAAEGVGGRANKRTGAAEQVRDV